MPHVHTVGMLVFVLFSFVPPDVDVFFMEESNIVFVLVLFSRLGSKKGTLAVGSSTHHGKRKLFGRKESQHILTLVGVSGFFDSSLVNAGWSRHGNGNTNSFRLDPEGFSGIFLDRMFSVSVFGMGVGGIWTRHAVVSVG
jgi:hypothetical protein